MFGMREDTVTKTKKMYGGVMEKLMKFLKEEDGVTAIEYALIAAVISLGILLSVEGVRDWISSRFDQVSAIPPAAPGGGS